jgi:hypothetical protein
MCVNTSSSASYKSYEQTGQLSMPEKNSKSVFFKINLYLSMKYGDPVVSYISESILNEDCYLFITIFCLFVF